LSEAKNALKCVRASLFPSRDCFGQKLSHSEGKVNVENNEVRSSSFLESLDAKIVS